MENEKDILKKDIISADSEGISLMTFSSTEELFAKTREKSLKVASALHLVTELFSETEPIRSSLRLEAVSLAMISAHQSAFKDTEQVKELIIVLDSITSLVSVLHTSNLLSDMNATILLHEVKMLMAMVQQNDAPVQHFSGAFLQELFSETAESETDTKEIKKDIPVTNYSTHQRQNLERNQTGNNGQYHNELKTKNTAPVLKKEIPVRSVKMSNTVNKIGRRESILNAIHHNGSSIKDIAKAIKDCSEKTIQRELNALIARGMVVREGEKRWSVYKKS